MCGVVGLLLKDPDLEPELGSMLVPMITALAPRGPDSSGVAVYAGTDRALDGATARPTLGVSLGSDEPVEWEEISTLLAATCEVGEVCTFPSGIRLTVPVDEVGRLVDVLAAERPEVRVLGTGRTLTVVKDTGSPTYTCSRHGMVSWSGRLAVAHTRMATESAVTKLHSHPFVPAPGLTVVHNGSFSNHASVRRRLEDEGVRFDSDNDSEVAARLLAARLDRGDDLSAATRWVMSEMDGFFTLVVGTDAGMAVVRDAFACKPAVIAETDAYVAVASEYRALAGLPGVERAHVFEPRPEEVYAWNS